MLKTISSKNLNHAHLFVEYFEVLQALLGDGEQADEPLLRAHGHLSVRAVHGEAPSSTASHGVMRLQ